MVSELAGEGAMPPQLPTPARRLLKIAKLRDCLRQQIQRGSLLLRRGVTKLKVFYYFNRSITAVQSINQQRWRRFSSSIVSGRSWSRSAKSLSKVLIIRHFFAIFKLKFSSRVLVDVVVFAVFSRSSRSRSAESSSAELVLAISSPQRRTRNKKQSIPPIPEFASEKSQRRVSDLKNLVGELRSEIKAATPNEAKQIKESMKRKRFRGTVTEIDPPPPPNFAVKKHLRSKPSRRTQTHSSAYSELQSEILQESSDWDSMRFLMLCFVLDLRCMSPPLLRECAAVIEACAEYAEIINTVSKTGKAKVKEGDDVNVKVKEKEMTTFLSLWTPNAKPLPFSPQIYPLRRQTQTGILLRNYPTISPTKPGQNPFTYRNGETQHSLSTKLSPIVRAAVTPGSDNDGEDMPPAPAPARMLKFLEAAPASQRGAVLLASTHLLCLFAPFCFSWDAAGVAVGLAVVTGALGVTLSYHRNLCHRSFKLPKWL